jgi:glycosyltransferase involved in cell wall biosynthesis
MIEAMACGTPTIAFGCGSVPELIDEGLTGFIVASEDEAVEALPKVAGLSRAKCRATFERRFTACRMAKDYLSIYEALVSEALEPQTVNSIQISSTVLS